MQEDLEKYTWNEYSIEFDESNGEIIVPRNINPKIIEVQFMDKWYKLDGWGKKKTSELLVENSYSEINEDNSFLEIPSKNLSKDQIHNHEHFVDFKETLYKVHNELEADKSLIATQSQAYLQNSVQNVEARVFAIVLDNIFKVKNKFDSEDEIISEAEKKKIIKDLSLVISTYYISIFPIYAQQLLKDRLNEFGDQVEFKMNKSVKEYIRLTATRASQSHIDTVLADILSNIKLTYQEALEEEIKKLQGTIGSDQDIFELARKKALEGASQQRIISEIKKSYGQVSNNRAKTIARTETNRAFTQSQYQADIQFLESTNLMSRAYKEWQTRSDNPCKFCLNLESRGPVKFEDDFVEFGSTLEYDFVKKNGEISVRKLPIDYEPLTAGNAHVNCGCIYKLVIKNDSGEFVENMLYGIIENGGKGSGNHGHKGRPGKLGGSSKSGGAAKAEKVSSDKYKSLTTKKLHELESIYGKSAYDNDRFDDDDREVIEDYTYLGYQHTNSILRTGYPDSESEEDPRYAEDIIIPKMRELVKKNSLKENTILYRGGEMDNKLVVGDSFTDKAFVSTSFNKKIAMDHVENINNKDDYSGYGDYYDDYDEESSYQKYFFEISAPKGSNGLFLGSDEKEWVLPEGGDYIVTSVSKPNRNKIITVGLNYEK